MPRIVVIREGGKMRQRDIDRANRGSRIRSYQGTAAMWASSGRWVTVKSSHVAAIKYDKHRKRMHVRFKDGDEGYYVNVLRATAEAFFMAPSMGKRVWKFRRAGWLWVANSED